MSGPAKLRIYHDASCPICRAEIEELAAVDFDQRLEVIDAASEHFADDHAREAGLDQEMLLSAMYVRDEQGLWHTGPDAFAQIYERVGIDRMARLWGSRTWRPLVNLGYRLFLVTRGLLVALGGDRVVRWFVRREAQAAARRADYCRTRED